MQSMSLAICKTAQILHLLLLQSVLPSLLMCLPKCLQRANMRRLLQTTGHRQQMSRQTQLCVMILMTLILACQLRSTWQRRL